MFVLYKKYKLNSLFDNFISNKLFNIINNLWYKYNLFLYFI